MTRFRQPTTIALLFALLLAGCSEQGQESVPMGDHDTTTTKTMNNDFLGRPVVFYNVENLFDTKNDPRTNDEDFTPYGYKRWDDERYTTKLERIEEVMLMFNEMPLLLGLAEIENRTVLNDLVQKGKMRDRRYGIVHFDSEDRRGIDCALLYDQDHFTVAHSTKLPVRLRDNRHFTTRDILYVQGKLNNEATLHVFVNHWSSRREGKQATEHKRLEAARTLRKKVDELLRADPQANILIMGDFNDHPTDRSLEHVLRAKESGYEGEGDLVNLLYDDHVQGDGTSVHDHDWAVLDQIIVSQSIYDHAAGIGIEHQDAKILKEKALIFTYRNGEQKPNATYGGRKYFGGFSDHLPVYVILK